MTGIGGNDKEFWCDGRNWPISSNRLGEVRSGDLYGRWRVEVTPAENRQETIFLHFIQVGGKALKTMTASSLLEDDKQAGVKFHAGNETITVLFNKCDPVGGKITIKRGWWKNIVDQCVLAGGKIDLKGGWWKSNIMDQSLSDKIQAQSDTASRTGRASYEKPKWVEMKQDGKDLENNGVLTNFAPIQLRLADNNKINKAQIKITVNDEDIAGYSKISLGDDRRTADIRVDIKAYMDKAGSEPVKLDEKGAGVQSLGVKKLKISYLDPVSGGSVKFRQRFQKPSGKPAQSAVFVSDLKEDQYLAEKGSWKWFNKNKNYAGQPIMVGLNVYEKGLMLVPPEVPVFAPSETDPIAFVEYTVPPECRMKQFKTVIGIDQFRAVIGMSQNTKGTAMFRVKLADKDGGWILAYESPAISRDCDIIEIAIPLQNKARLRLESVGCSHLSAHAVWADARFE